MSIIKTIKQAIQNKQMVKYHKQAIDLQTANALMTVYDSLNDNNKKKFKLMAEEELPILINFCWEQVV